MPLPGLTQQNIKIPDRFPALRDLHRHAFLFRLANRLARGAVQVGKQLRLVGGQVQRVAVK